MKLAYFGGLTNREIAGNLGLGEATVERRLRHALDVASHCREGRGGRRVIALIAVWLSGRWLADGSQRRAGGSSGGRDSHHPGRPAPAVSPDGHAPRGADHQDDRRAAGPTTDGAGAATAAAPPPVTAPQVPIGSPRCRARRLASTAAVVPSPPPPLRSR
jgi:hypothetical protein